LSQRTEHIDRQVLSNNLQQNLEQIENLLGNSYDLVIRSFAVGGNNLQVAVLFISGLENNEAVENIISDLTIKFSPTSTDLKADSTSPSQIFQETQQKIIRNQELEPVDNLSLLFDQLFLGDTILLIDGINRGIICNTKQWELRSLEEPEAERVIRGPRDGFIEALPVNTSLLRRRIRTPNLWIESLEIGTVTKTKVAIAYIKGLAQEGLVNEVRTRLQEIEIDNVIESGVLEEMIEDTFFTPFPLMHRSERTDIAMSEILEGRVAILTDGTPFVLFAPTRLHDMLQGPDDYYEKFPVGSFIRLGRMLAFVLAIFLPAIYIATVNFHTELIPSTLLLGITAARQGVPFPVAMEVILMEIVFEMLREAGLRLPGMIGPAISIVGALILGEAAIQANLVSPAVVIVVAATGIASFVAPSFELNIATRIIRFCMIILGATLGLFGVQFGFILLTIHLCSLRSFGYPYLAPFAPLIIEDWKDSFIRAPWWWQKKRPHLEGGRDPVRTKRNKAQTPPSVLDDSDYDS